MQKKLLVQQTLFGALVTVVAMVALGATQDVWRANWHVPFYPVAGDTMSFLATSIKGVLQEGSYGPNAHLGFPVGAEMRDYPAVDQSLLWLLDLASRLHISWPVFFNGAYAFSFVVSSVVAAYCFRAVGISYAMAACAGLLFGFSFFHVARAYGHITFAWFDFLPAIACVMAVRLASVEPLQLLVRKRWSLVCGVFLLGLLLGVYFMTFALMLWAFACTCSWASRPGAWSELRDRVLLVAAALAGFLVQTWPTAAWIRAHGAADNLRRHPIDSELYGLKLTSLLMPRPGHRIPALAAMAEGYIKSSVLTNENRTASLGLIGSAGFIVCILAMLFAAEMAQKNKHGLSPSLVGRFLMFLFLVGTIGGVGSLVAHGGFPQIRSYNRISVYIMFFALCGAGLLVDRFVRQRAAHMAFAFLLTCIGLADTTQQPWAKSNVDAHLARTKEFDQFVEKIEQALPERAAVLQLPDMLWPENGPVGDIMDYEHLRPYLHAKELRWSYGASRNNPETHRFHQWANQPLHVVLADIHRMPFDAIWIDMRGYPADQHELMLAELRQRCGEAIAHDEVSNIWVFRLPAPSKS